MIVIILLFFILFIIVNNKDKNKKKYKIEFDNNLMIICNKKSDSKSIINIDDEKEFMEKYKQIKIYEDIHIIIDSTGGDISSSDAIIHILNLHEGVINIYIPKIAYSAGSMIALCGDNIYLNTFSLMSPVDPQVDFMDNDLISVNFYIKMKRLLTLKRMSQDNILKYYESKILYDDNIRNLKKILARNYSDYVIRKVIKDFAYGKYPHSKQFNHEELYNMGLNIKLGIPNFIKHNYKKYCKYCN